MKTRLTSGYLLLCILFTLAGCGPRLVSTPQNVPSAQPDISIPADLSWEQISSLRSLRQVDHYPLYTMNYIGEYHPRVGRVFPEMTASNTGSTPSWACSLFTVLLDEDNLLYGRNFDWQFSPALLLFTDPPDGYASVSMIDIAYLGFDSTHASDIPNLPIGEQIDLLDAPHLPFDGMNEYGLAIGMAAVPGGNLPHDVNKETIGSLGIIRKMLDNASTVDKAVDIMKSYNVAFGGGPPVHYLMADATGKSVLVEYYSGDMYIYANEQPWHLTTNFLRSSVDDPTEGGCWRYNKIDAHLIETNGLVDTQAAMQLLADVSQNSTQWSILYQMSNGSINVVMGQQYQNMHHFQLDLVDK